MEIKIIRQKRLTNLNYHDNEITFFFGHTLLKLYELTKENGKKINILNSKLSSIGRTISSLIANIILSIKKYIYEI